MKKIVKRVGKAICVTFSKEEQDIFGLRTGQIVDIELSVLKNKDANKLKGGTS